MSAAHRTIAIGLVIAAATLILYARRLGDTPIYLSPDEVIIAVDAHSVASTGHDVEGRFLPLFFNIQMPGEDRKGWFFPMIFYLSALVLKVLPVSETAARVPTMLVGVCDVVLMYCLANTLFGSHRMAAIAAALLALSPSHFMLSRLGLDYLYVLPFTLAWLWGLVSYLQNGDRWALRASVATLGVGVFGYIASVLLMPLYLFLTCLVLVYEKKPRAVVLGALATFSVPLLILVPWLLMHPSAFSDTMTRYDLYDAHKVTVFQGLRSLLRFGTIEQLTTRYWNFFNPAFLFLSGDAQMMFSTRLAGVFLAPMAIFLALGIYSAAVRPDPVKLVVVAGLLTGPLVALIVAEDGAIHRATAMLGFGVLLAMYGVNDLLAGPRADRPRRAAASARATGRTLAPFVAVFLLALLPLQFLLFQRDYYGSYRVRSSYWFGGNLRGALESMIALDRTQPVPGVYFSTLRATDGRLDTANRWMDAYWRFYLTKNGRRELLDRTAHFDAAALQTLLPRSLVLGNIGDVTTDNLIKKGDLEIVELIPEVGDRDPFFAVLRR